MSDTLFRLMERHQKLDELLRRAKRRRFADPIEIALIRKMKLGIRNRLVRLVREPAPAD